MLATVTLSHPLAGASKYEESQHHPLPAKSQFSTLQSSGWGQREQAVMASACYNQEADMQTQTRHYHTAMLKPTGTSFSQRFPRASLPRTLSNFLAKENGYMQSTQGILLDFLALMAKETGDSKLHATITIRKKVIGKLSQSRNFTDRRQTQSQTTCEKGLIRRKTSVCDLTQISAKKNHLAI